MAARDRADRVAQRQQHEAEGQRDPQGPDVLTRQHRRAHPEEHQQEGAEELAGDGARVQRDDGSRVHRASS